MGDTIVIVVSIILAAILMFVFPMMQMSSNNDNVAQVTVQGLTSEYVSESAIQAELTLESYNDFMQDLHATGNTYDVEFEIQRADGNPDKKTQTVDVTLIGEQEFFSVFTDEVLATLKEKGVYILKDGDIITITVTNNNKTLFQTFLSAFALTVSDSNQIVAKFSATVGANGQ